MSREDWTNDVLRKRWDDEAQIYSEWNEAGFPVNGTPRPYTPEEIATANFREQANAQAVQEVALAEAQRALTVAAMELAPPPTTGEAWVQPTVAANAYPKDSEVTHGGKTWISLTPFNVWEPGVSGWREVVAEGYPAWVQPTGGHDAYNVGSRVTHNGQDWESTTPANVWEPGVFGWVVIP